MSWCACLEICLLYLLRSYLFCICSNVWTLFLFSLRSVRILIGETVVVYLRRRVTAIGHRLKLCWVMLLVSVRVLVVWLFFVCTTTPFHFKDVEEGNNSFFLFLLRIVCPCRCPSCIIEMCEAFLRRLVRWRNWTTRRNEWVMYHWNVWSSSSPTGQMTKLNHMEHGGMNESFCIFVYRKWNMWCTGNAKSDSVWFVVGCMVSTGILELEYWSKRRCHKNSQCLF